MDSMASWVRFRYFATLFHNSGRGCRGYREKSGYSVALVYGNRQHNRISNLRIFAQCWDYRLAVVGACFRTRIKAHDGLIMEVVRRTLFAVGIATLASMLFAPYQGGWNFLGNVFYVSNPESGYPYVPDWCGAWHWFPIFWIEPHNPVLWTNFIGQTAFLSVLAAVIVNIRKRGAT